MPPIPPNAGIRHSPLQEKGRSGRLYRRIRRFSTHSEPGEQAFVLIPSRIGAGEQLVADLAATLKHVEIFVTRLPRLATDQTASLMTVKTASGLEVLLPIVRRMLAGRARFGS